MSQLFTPVCSIAATRRRRFLWAAWWTQPPRAAPFTKPDASEGGARTREEALRQAQAAAGRPLVEIEARWARAWSRILTGEKPWPVTDKEQAAPRPRPSGEAAAPSIWRVLGVESTASVAEIRRAFRARALTSHPDHGGDADTFRALRRAYDEAMRRRERGAARPRRRK